MPTAQVSAATFSLEEVGSSRSRSLTPPSVGSQAETRWRRYLASQGPSYPYQVRAKAERLIRELGNAIASRDPGGTACAACLFGTQECCFEQGFSYSEIAQLWLDEMECDGGSWGLEVHRQEAGRDLVTVGDGEDRAFLADALTIGEPASEVIRQLR